MKKILMALAAVLCCAITTTVLTSCSAEDNSSGDPTHDKAVVGTINLDFRSLFLHFECAAFIWHNPVIEEIEADFEETLKECQRITLKHCKDTPFLTNVCGRALRLIAPLM